MLCFFCSATCSGLGLTITIGSEIRISAYAHRSVQLCNKSSPWHTPTKPTNHQSLLINTFFIRNRLKNGDVFILVGSNFGAEIVLHHKRDTISMVNLQETKMNINAVSGDVLEFNLSIMCINLILGKVNTRWATCTNNRSTCMHLSIQTSGHNVYSSCSSTLSRSWSKQRLQQYPIYHSATATRYL